MSNQEKTNRIILTGVMMALIIVATMLIRIPIPFSSGYVHLGDAMVFLSVLILGWRYAAIAAGIGSLLADVMVGAAIWAPWTLVIKACMAIIMGMFIKKAMKGNAGTLFGMPLYHLVGMIFAGIFMVAGYYLAEGVIYGNFVVPVLSIPWNVGQFIVGLGVASIVSSALIKTPARKFFTYQFAE
ncbi:MAG: ECF transporter S component [Anaerovoracaceae bacterium]